MSLKGTKRVLSIVLLMALLLNMLPVMGFAAEAETAPVEEPVEDVIAFDTSEDTQSNMTELKSTVEQQIRAFAKSINKSGADDSAAKALAKHGMTGGGKKLSVGKNHALTATIWNSELFQQAVIGGCSGAVSYMQLADFPFRSAAYLH